MYNEPLLEIRNVHREEGSPKDEDASKSSIDQRNAFDYMPKYVLRQINERRYINTNAISQNSPTTATAAAAAAANVLTPYALYNTKNQYDLIENATRDLNRKSNKTTKIQSQMLQASQQKQITNLIQAQQQQMQVQQQNGHNSLKNQKLSSTSSINASLNPNNSSFSNLAKVNEEFLNSLVNNLNMNQLHHNSSVPNNLFSSTFVSMNPNNQLKTQYEKISRAASTVVLPSSNTTRQKISK